MVRICDSCGREYEARRKDSRTCSPACRQRRGRGAKPAPDLYVPADNPLLIATKRELEAAGKLDTRLGQQALVLAARVAGSETNAGIAALSRELCMVVAEAIGGRGSAAPRPPDAIDEVRARRDVKRMAQP